MQKAIGILSGGLDSAVNLAWGVTQFDLILAVTFDYGQRAVRQEIEKSRLLCQHYHVSHRVIALPFLSLWTKTALTNPEQKLPHLSSARLDDEEETAESAAKVWVPNRNGIFLNVAASLAESLEANVLLVGFNKEEGATFPDNSAPFLNAANQSLSFSTLNHVEVNCKTLSMTKNEIVKLGLDLKLPFQYVWSCYEGNEQMCGLCESCLRLKRAVETAPPSLMETLAFAH